MRPPFVSCVKRSTEYKIYKLYDPTNSNSLAYFFEHIDIGYIVSEISTKTDILQILKKSIF